MTEPVLRHQAFEPRRAVVLGEARLSDRQRVSLLFQGAAVLAHLEVVGWRPGGGLEDGGVDARGLLVLPPPHPGPSFEQPQELLLRLLARLFGDEKVLGRGEAKRVAKRLARNLRQSLAPVPAQRWLVALLSEAPFLWQGEFGAARGYLVAERLKTEGATFLIAGPSSFRRRLLGQAQTRGELESLLASERARELWRSQAEGDPRALLAKGRVPAALAAWEIEPPTDDESRLSWARALVSLGRSERGLEVLKTLSGPTAKLLRLRCQVDLGRLVAAQMTIRQLSEEELSNEETLELAELAVKTLANLGRLEELEPWVRRARRVAKHGTLAARAGLLAATAAWDRGDLDEAERELAASRAALEDAGLDGRWRKVAGQVAHSRGETTSAGKLLAEALASRRRWLGPREAGELWNELGLCRAALGDLAGAERAFLHTARLWAGLDGPRATTLALFNLAEIRLRRGRLRGVRALLEEVTLENRLATNLRGSVQDLELWARYELAFGRFDAALDHARRALLLIHTHQLSFREDVLRLLSARALAWMGRGDEAALELERGGERALAELEPEERPALLAQAGMRDRALALAATTSWSALWQSVLERGQLPASGWPELAELEPFRQARCVLDVAQLAPQALGAEIKAQAAGIFRAQSAHALAERLEGEEAGAWRELVSCLEQETKVESLISSLSRLEPSLRLEHRRGESLEILLDGAGGAERRDLPSGGGKLVASASRQTPRLHALLLLLAAELGGDPESRPRAEPQRPRASTTADGFIGQNPALLAVIERLRKLAPSDLPVLILGESGTGKELAARLVHGASPRADRPFVAMNCAAVSENLLLSDLFGHVRGAFTGADRDRAGVFETAQGGTVFLDEIGDLPLSAQGMLLRVLQESEVRRVGESLPRKIKARIVAATHRDLAAMVAAGSFRNDLYFRLKVAKVLLPPLAERRDDVHLLAEHFLAKGLPGQRRVKLSKAARETLIHHTWPGNVRELENVLRVAAQLAAAEDGCIEPHHLELPVSDQPAASGAEAGGYQQLIDAYRTRLIKDALTAAGGNRAEAARRLKLTRQAFSYLVQSLRISLG